MRALLPLALVLAALPHASASCAGTTSTTVCLATMEGEPDFVLVTFDQSYAPAGSTHACLASGAGGEFGLVGANASAFAAACLARDDPYAGSTDACLAASGSGWGCAAVGNDNGLTGPSGAAAEGEWLCLTLAGVRDCALMP